MDSDHLQKVAYMRQFSLLAAYAFWVIQNTLAMNCSTQIGIMIYNVCNDLQLGNKVLSSIVTEGCKMQAKADSSNHDGNGLKAHTWFCSTA